MSRVDYHMSAADLRTFDRWQSRGAAILLATLVLMPWLIGIGPNSVRPEAARAATPNASAAPEREVDPPSLATDTAAARAPAQAARDDTLSDPTRR
jgi:hypothetical protein